MCQLFRDKYYERSGEVRAVCSGYYSYSSWTGPSHSQYLLNKRVSSLTSYSVSIASAGIVELQSGLVPRLNAVFDMRFGKGELGACDNFQVPYQN